MFNNELTSSKAGKESMVIQGKENNGLEKNNQGKESLKFKGLRLMKIIGWTITENKGSIVAKSRKQYFKANYHFWDL